MGLFNFGKKNDEGWDENAAAEFHNKAPAVRTSNARVQETFPPKAEARTDENADSDSVVDNVNGDSVAVVTDASESGRQEENAAPARPENGGVVFGTPVSNGATNTADVPSEVGTAPKETTSTVPMDRASMQQFLLGYSRDIDDAVTLGKELDDYLYDLLTVVQDLNVELEDCQKENTRLTGRLTELRSEIDVLEEKAPAFDKTLRELVLNLNAVLEKNDVEGVEHVEVPKYSAAGELSGIITTTGNKFSMMIPALEKSREGAATLFKTLKPESSAYAPTQELLDFSTNGIVSIKQFIGQLVELKNDLERSLENYATLSNAYAQTLEESETQKAKVADIIAIIKSFHQSGDRLRQLLSA